MASCSQGYSGLEQKCRRTVNETRPLRTAYGTPYTEVVGKRGRRHLTCSLCIKFKAPRESKLVTLRFIARALSYARTVTTDTKTTLGTEKTN